MIRTGSDGVLIACGTLLSACCQAAERLAEEGIEFGVINARFVKPLDTETILPAIQSAPVAITIEEGARMGGFGSAVLEAAADAGINTSHIRRLGIPDSYVEHGSRHELLADLGLDAAGIVRVCREWAAPRVINRPHKATAARAAT